MKIRAFLCPLVISALNPAVGVDYGNEYSKIAVTSPRHKLDLILNQQSGRKTRTAVKLSKSLPRQFGQSAYNLEWTDVLPDNIYPFIHHNVTPQEPYVHFLSYLRDLVDANVVKTDHLLSLTGAELALAVPVGTDYRARQRHVQLLDLLQFKTVGLIPAPMLAALSHGADISASLDTKVVRKLFLDFGHKYLQACLVVIENVATSNATRLVAGARAGNHTTAVKHVSCDRSKAFGAHAIDLMLANHIIKDFDTNLEGPLVKVRRTVTKLASNAKHTLSVAPRAHVSYENLHNGKNLSKNIERKLLEELIIQSDWYTLVDRSLQQWAKLSFQEVELLGNGWRVPVINKLIEKRFGAGKISMKCNADEAAVVGATMVATNSTSAYKIKPIYFDVPLTEGVVLKTQVSRSNTNSKTSTSHFDPIGQPLIIPAGTLYGTQESLKISKVDMDGRGDFFRALLISHDEKHLLAAFRISGFDTIRRMRRKSVKDFQDKLDSYNDAVMADFRTTFTDSRNETHSLKSPVESTWEGSKLIPTFSDVYNITIKVTLDYTGLIRINSAMVTWLETQVSEIVREHSVDLPKREDDTEHIERSANSGVLSTSTTTLATTESTASESQSTEASESTSLSTLALNTTTAPEKAIIKSYTWKVVESVARKRSLSIHEMEAASKADSYDKLQPVTPLPFTKKELNQLKTNLQNWSKMDKDVEKLNESRNSFESTIYQVKEKVVHWGEELLLNSVDLTEAKKILSEAEDWLLYGEGSSSSELSDVKNKETIVIQLENKLKKMIDKHPKMIAKEIRTELAKARSKLKRIKNPNPEVHKNITDTMLRFEEWLTSQSQLLTDLTESAANETAAALKQKWSETSKIFTTALKSIKLPTAAPSKDSSSSSDSATSAPMGRGEL